MGSTDWFDRRTGLSLYAFTLLLELPAVIVRFVLTYVVVWLVVLIAGGGDHTVIPPIAALAAAIGPVLWSLAAVFVPVGTGWLWQAKQGGRDPSQREKVAYTDALATLKDHDPDITEPARWFVVDEPQASASVLGDTLMLSRGVLASGHLEAVLAHELGHLNSFDGKLTAALNRLVLWPGDMTAPKDKGEHDSTGHILAHALFWLAGGGVGLWMMRPAWGKCWREREYAADHYAAELGQGEELAEYFETNALLYDRPVPFVWLKEHGHPPVELRIDRLHNHADTHVQSHAPH